MCVCVCVDVRVSTSEEERWGGEYRVAREGKWYVMTSNSRCRCW